MRYGYLFILTQIEAHKENGGGKGHFNSCTHDKYGYDIYKLPKQMKSFISSFFSIHNKYTSHVAMREGTLKLHFSRDNSRVIPPPQT